MSVGDEFASRVRQAVQGEGHNLLRLGSADISVTFRFRDDGRPVTLLLDRYPPEVTDDDGGDVVIELDRSQDEPMSRGELVLSTCFMQGKASYEGDVRRYLAVDPILRGLLYALNQEGD